MTGFYSSVNGPTGVASHTERAAAAAYHPNSRQQEIEAFRQMCRDCRRSSIKLTFGGASAFIVGALCSSSGVGIVEVGGYAASIAGGLIMMVGLAAFFKVVRRAAGLHA